MDKQENKISLTLYAEEDSMSEPNELKGINHIRHFYHAVDNNEAPAMETMQFIAQALKLIDKSKTDPKKALGLTKKQGQPIKYKEALDTAIQVEALILEGYGKDGARQKIAKQLKKSFKTVRKNHKDHRKSAQMMLTQAGINEHFSHVFSGGVKGIIKNKHTHG